MLKALFPGGWYQRRSTCQLWGVQRHLQRGMNLSNSMSSHERKYILTFRLLDFKSYQQILNFFLHSILFKNWNTIFRWAGKLGPGQLDPKELSPRLSGVQFAWNISGRALRQWLKYSLMGGFWNWLIYIWDIYQNSFLWHLSIQILSPVSSRRTEIKF